MNEKCTAQNVELPRLNCKLKFHKIKTVDMENITSNKSTCEQQTVTVKVEVD